MIRGLAASLLVGLIAAAPLAWMPFLGSDDGLVHLWRVWQYNRATAAVGPLVRWAPDAAYGYGTPLFTFYNPLAYVVGALLMEAGLTAAEATRLLLAGSLVVAAAGSYRLGLAWGGGAVGGLCAALLYTAAPYRLATVYQRGGLAEALGLALAPWAVLAACRLVERGGAGRIAGLALASGAIVLLHTITALLTLPLAALIALAHALERPRATWAAGTARLTLAFAFGALLSASYWLPAFAQQGTVQLERARWSGEVVRFQAGFAWPWQLVQVSAAHDYGRTDDTNVPIAQRFPRLGGLAAVALALGGVVGLFTGALRRPRGLVALAAVATCLALASPGARPLWDRVELLGAVQLGWRFLAPLLVAAIALATPLGSARLGRWRWAALALCIAAAAGALIRLPATPLPWSAEYERPTELIAFERKAGQFALGALREYVPVAMSATPEELVRLPAAASAAGLAPPTAPAAALAVAPTGAITSGASLPAPIDARLLPTDGFARRYALITRDPTVVTLDLFFHPALIALLNGQPVPLRPVGDDGLVSLDLPSGAHELTIGPAATPLERGATLGSATALALCLLLLAVAAARRLAVSGSAITLRAGVAVAAALVLLAALVAAPPGWLVHDGSAAPGAPIRRAESGAPARAHVALNAPFDLAGAAHALGFTADASLVPTAGVLTVDLHLLALRGFAENEPLALWLEDASARRVAERLGAPGGGFRPTSRWRPGQLLAPRTELRLPPGLPAGRYTLGLELGQARTPLGPVDLPAAGRVSAQRMTSPFVRHESIFGGHLVLDGYTYDPDPSHGSLRGSFWWRRVADAGPDWYEATLRLLDKQGRELAAQSRRMGGPDQLRVEADFHLRPPPLPAESYRLELFLRPINARDGQPGPPLPAHTFDGHPGGVLPLTWFDVRDPCNCPPPGARIVDHRWGGNIRLVAWEASRQGEELDLALYWRADATPARDWTVFIHALEGERVVSQIDDQPNAGRRPTTNWRPGDVVRDAYRLRAPAATAIRFGLYRPEGRLPLEPPTPDNAIRLDLPISRAP